MRIFIAAILPDEIKEYIGQYICNISGRVNGVKWEKKEKLHITLKFIGAIEENGLLALGSSLEEFITNKEPVYLKILGFGGFPNLIKPRILYIRFSHSDLLEDIKNHIESELQCVGISKDNRTFIPHATIGRIKARFNILEPLTHIDNLEFKINTVAIVNSILTERGSNYTIYSEFKLG